MGFFSDLLGSFTGGLIGESPAEKQRKDIEGIRRQILAATSPEELLSTIKALRPQFRELVATGIGPSIQSSIATRVARAGAGRTGVGIAAQNIGSVIPEIEAIRQAAATAQGLQRQKVGALSGFQALPFDDPATQIANLFGSFFNTIALGGIGGGGGGLSPSVLPGAPIGGGTPLRGANPQLGGFI